MSLLASIRRQLAQSRVTEVKTGSAVGVPLAIGSVGASLAAVSDEERAVGLLAVDGDNDSLAAVLGTSFGSLERKVAHGNQVVVVDIVESLGLDPVAHNGALVLVVEVATASLALLDVVVVCSETLTLEEGSGLGRRAGGESHSREGNGSYLHFEDKKSNKLGCALCLGVMRVEVWYLGNRSIPVKSWGNRGPLCSQHFS